MYRTIVVALAALTIFFGACSKKTAPANPATSEAENKQVASPRLKVEACSLVSVEEVAAIQKAPITGAQPQEIPFLDFLTSECHYSSSAPDMSVTISVIEPDPHRLSKRSVSDYWHESLDRFRPDKPSADEEKEEQAEKRGEQSGRPGANSEEEEKERNVRVAKVEGIGEQAYWSGSMVGGTLYVLKGENLLRISVGGVPDQSVKLDKCKALAQKAIARLPQ